MLCFRAVFCKPEKLHIPFNLLERFFSEAVNDPQSALAKIMYHSIENLTEDLSLNVRKWLDFVVVVLEIFLRCKYHQCYSSFLKTFAKYIVNTMMNNTAAHD